MTTTHAAPAPSSAAATPATPARPPGVPLPARRAEAEALDAADPLAPLRQRFELPEGVVYLDGNSLGALPRGVAERLQQAVRDEWGRGLIRSWNDAGWYPAPQRTAARIAPLVGAAADELIVADSTSVNLFKLLAAALRLRPGRTVILGERGNFPTDGYVADGVAKLVGAESVAVAPEDIPSAIERLGPTLAVLMLTHVHYKTGRLWDMARLTAQAQGVGALALWDLAHTAGAVPCALDDCEVDLAVGCGYKYLNGGPGAPAFAFVARRHQAALEQPIAGWHGHAKPFDFDHAYTPAPGIERLLVGTAPQLSLIALEKALEAFDGVDLAALRAKSLALTGLFIDLVERELAGHGFGLVTPRVPAERGSQVSLTHPQGYAIMQALIARGVIGDFRAPDILRFGFAPLYVRHVDVWDAVAALREVMASGEWQRPEFMQRKAVT